jgi:hypothetical protein
LSQRDFDSELPRTKQILTAATKGKIPVSTKDVKVIALKLHQTSQTTPDFWTTLAAIVNYQSMLEQLSGEAPDPSKVSEPCPGFTRRDGIVISYGNTFIGGIHSTCLVDLDSNTFTNVTFKDSIIRYHGEPTTLHNVTFINCTFLLDLGSIKTKPEKPALLLALLESPDQRIVKID